MARVFGAATVRKRCSCRSIPVISVVRGHARTRVDQALQIAPRGHLPGRGQVRVKMKPRVVGVRGKPAVLAHQAHRGGRGFQVFDQAGEKTPPLGGKLRVFAENASRHAAGARGRPPGRCLDDALNVPLPVHRGKTRKPLPARIFPLVPHPARLRETRRPKAQPPASGISSR